MLPIRQRDLRVSATGNVVIDNVETSLSGTDLPIAAAGYRLRGTICSCFDILSYDPYALADAVLLRLVDLAGQHFQLLRHGFCGMWA